MTHRIRRERGNSAIETAMFMPLFILLLVGTYQFGRATFLYYQVHKTLYGVARLVATRQGANLCDGGDAEVLAAKNLAISGSSDGTQPLITGLTSDQVSIRLERQEADSAILSECECSLTGCDISLGGRQPEYVVVSMPEGFPVQITIPYLLQQTVTFRPTVRVPMGGL
jgi:Flp pilus assembly protein TadG